jgi:DsbC/DsbD-like thiol-disulfide interchange protein
MRLMPAWMPLLLVAWMSWSPWHVAPQPVRVAGVSWCRMPTGWGEGPALLVRFEVEHDWHMYWMNPGDSGAPPAAKAVLPEGWRLGQPVWPRPRVQQTDGETVFVHEGSWGWLVPIEGGPMPDFPVELSLTWMVCKQHCTVGKATVKVPPPSGTLAPCPEDVGGWPFPQRLQDGDEASVQDERLRLRCQARGRLSARFIQATDPGVQMATNPAEVPVRDGVATLEAPLRVRPQDADGHALAVRGLLLLGDRPRDPCVWIERKLPVPSTPRATGP